MASYNPLPQLFAIGLLLAVTVLAAPLQSDIHQLVRRGIVSPTLEDLSTNAGVFGGLAVASFVLRM